MPDQTNSNDGWLTVEQLRELGFNSIGENVLISSTCRVYGANNISIGNDVRIDDFCILACAKGSLVLEGFNHIAAYCYLNCAGGLYLSLFANISSRCAIYSSSDDFSGKYMMGPTIPKKYTNVTFGKVVLGRNSILGTSTTVLPGVTIGDYSAVGACSLVNKSIESQKIAVGIPAKIVNERSTEIVSLENDLLLERGV